MRLATSTNLHDFVGGKYISYEESIKHLANIGFNVIDINFCHAIQKDNMLQQDDWEARVEQLAEYAQELGVTFNQSHMPFYNMLDPNFAKKELFDEMIRRSIIASGKLGVPWIASHCGTNQSAGNIVAASHEGTKRFYQPFIELAQQHNTGLLFENMANFGHRKVFSADVDELVNLVDDFARDHDNVGILWDFGHANIAKADQVASLEFIGERLKGVHVQDSYAVVDDHLAPYLGTIDWAAIMPTFKRIGYQGDFTYEIHNFTRRLPAELRESACRYALDLGNYLLTLAK